MDTKIVVPRCFPQGWLPPEDAPGWAVPSASECEIPPTIRQVGIERVLNRKVVAASCHLGTYGMGGAGLVGMQLEGDPEEFLVLCLWGAACWLHWDDKIIDDNETFGKDWGTETETQRGHKKFESEITGTILSAFYLADDYCRLKFGSHSLEIKKDPETRPLSTRREGNHVWDSEESLKDAWFLTPTWQLLV